MPSIEPVLGDITTTPVDAMVNAANTRMRGGGGVDGAIHRAGGPAILEECIARFRSGLPTGEAGWTTAGDLPARWVIHTVGPDYTAGQRDRSLLTSCYRRALEVADGLGVRTMSFPLISAGVYGWPKADAIDAGLETVAAARTAVETVKVVVIDQRSVEEVEARLARWTPLRILQGVRVCHQRGHHAIRAFPGMSATGMHWRVTIALAGEVSAGRGGFEPAHDVITRYTTGSRTEFAGERVDITTDAQTVADLILAGAPRTAPTAADPAYVEWYEGLMRLVERPDALPIAYADDVDDAPGWEVGWGSGVRYPPPPSVG